MAINILKEPHQLYPAYNDSYIKFNGTVSGLPANKAEITIPQFTSPFIIYPDTIGNFQFNLKEIIKTLFGGGGFEDSTFIPSGFHNIRTDKLIDLDVNISLQSDAGVFNQYKNYEFLKAVKQVGEKVYDNNLQILSKSNNGIDYSLTYFEGFEFQYELLKVDEDSTIKVKNLNSGDDVSFAGFESSNTLRLWIDKVNSNLTTTNILPLSDTINKLEIFENDVFKTNLRLRKKPAECGVYLKWFNNQGGFNYWLFDKFYQDSTKSKSIGEITRNSFLNLDETPKSFSYSQGKETSKTMKLKSTLKDDEIYYVKDILSSPSVQLYTSQTPFEKGEWITVNVGGTINESTKRTNGNEITVTIDLPVQYNITY